MNEHNPVINYYLDDFAGGIVGGLILCVLITLYIPIGLTQMIIHYSKGGR